MDLMGGTLRCWSTMLDGILYTCGTREQQLTVFLPAYIWHASFGTFFCICRAIRFTWVLEHTCNTACHACSVTTFYYYPTVTMPTVGISCFPVLVQLPYKLFLPFTMGSLGAILLPSWVVYPALQQPSVGICHYLLGGTIQMEPTWRAATITFCACDISYQRFTDRHLRFLLSCNLYSLWSLCAQELC
jgi:hypothetical protein